MSKNKFSRHFFSAIIFLMLLACFCGCNNVTGDNTKPSGNNMSSDDGKAYLCINVASASRTALPHFDVDSIKTFKFELEGKKDGASSFSAIDIFEDESDNLDNLKNEQIPIETGDWIFRLIASKDGTVLSDEITKKITAGANTISFDLKWEDENLDITKTGNLSFTINYSTAPTKSDVAKVTGQLYSYDPDTREETELTDDEYKETELSISAYAVTYSLTDIPVSHYRVKIRLYDDKENLIIMWPALAIITGGQTSTETQPLSSLNEVYTVQFNLKGGAINPNSGIVLPEKYTRFTYQNDSWTMPVSGQVDKQGYSFGGWYENESYTGDTVTSISADATGNKIYYAKWVPRSGVVYKVKHWKQILNAGTEQNDTNYELDDTQNLSGTTDSQIATLEIKDTTTGNYYGFDAPSSSEINTAQAQTVLPDGSLEVNLYYKRHQTRYIYNDNVTTEEITVPERALCHYGQTITISDEEPSRTGYTFMGWTLVSEPTDSDTVYKKGTANTTVTVELTEITFYAKWSANPCTVTFETVGGSVIAPQTVLYDQLVTQPDSAPTKEKYIFDGWYADSIYKKQFDFTEPIKGDTPIYAKWAPAYAKINDTYYANVDDTGLAIDKLKQQPEYQNGEPIYMTITLYSLVRASDLGKAIYNGNNSGTGIIGQLKQNPYFVTFIIDEEANIQIVDDQCESLFAGCDKFISIDISGLNTTEITTMNGMFMDCSGLTSITFGSDFDSTELIHFSDAFNGCTSLQTLDLSCFNTPKLRTMSGTFRGCTNLVVLDLSSFDTSGVTNMKNLFYEDTNLETIYASNAFVTTSVQSGYDTDLFTHCDKLTGQKGSTYLDCQISNIDPARIDQGASAPGYFCRKPNPIGSIVLKTGTIIPYSENLELSSEEKQDAIAIIIYDGKATDTLGDKILGVGLEMTRTKMMADKDPSDGTITVVGYNEFLNSSDDDGNVFMQAVQACSDYSAHAQDYYPAIYWVSNYKNAASNLSGTSYENGWYIPAKNEIKCIYDNMAVINSAMLKINESAVVFDDDWEVQRGNYWAATQDPNYRYQCGIFKFWVSNGGGNTYDAKDYGEINVKPFATAIHEF